MRLFPKNPSTDPIQRQRSSAKGCQALGRDLFCRGKNIGEISISEQKLYIPNFRAFMPMTYLFFLNFPAQLHWVLG